MTKLNALLLLLGIATVVSAQTTDTIDKARVFITDSQSWSIAGSGGGANGAYGSSMAGGARPQTAEIVKTFGQRCPDVITNNKQEKSDYVVVLDHEGGKGFARHKNKVAVFNRVSGDSVVSKSTVSLGGSVQTACEAITADWAAHGNQIRAASAPTPTTDHVGTGASPVQSEHSNEHVGAGAPPVQAEQSSAEKSLGANAQLQITSTPDAADIEIDGSFVGNTPSTVGVAAGQHQISIKKSGFKPWERRIAVSSGQVNVNAALEPGAK
jgi:PEGA domain